MANGTIVSVWKEHGFACVAIRVLEGTQNVEYIGRVPLDPTWDALSTANKKTALIAACKATRDSQQPDTQDLPAITGAVVL